MSTLRAYLGVAGLTDVGYRLYARNTALAARSTTDILDEGAGWYSAGGVTLAGDNVRWDSTGTPAAVAREDISLRLEQAAELAAIKAKTDLISAGAITILSPVDVTGSNITVRAGDTWSIPINGLGNLTGVDKLWFSVNAPGAADSAAKLFLELAAGLTRVNGAAYTPTTDGSITVTDASAGNITVAIDEAVSAQLGGSGGQPGRWTIKKRIGGDTVTLATGLFTISKAGIGATE